MELGALRAGDICWQYAQKATIAADEDIPPDKIKLVVSDEHGVLSKTVLFSLHIFDTYFQAADSPNLYFRRVQVEEVNENQVRFFALNKSGKLNDNIQSVKKSTFMEAYFIPQHQMGDAKPA